MAIITEDELQDKNRNLWLKALSAAELGNHGYALTLLQSILPQEVEFIQGWSLYRKAAVEKQKGTKKLFKGLSKSSLGFLGKRGKGDVASFLRSALESLASDPYNEQVNTGLFHFLVDQGFPDAAAFCLETVRKGHPENTKTLHLLGEHYMSRGLPDKAVEVYNQVIKADPSDLDAIKASKDASARASMTTQGWGEASSYRDLIKDKEQAISLEQQNRGVLTDEMIDQQLQQWGEKYEAEPENSEVVRHIAELYEKKRDYTTAQQWYEYGKSLRGEDPFYEKKMGELKELQIQEKIKELEQAIEKTSDAQQANALRAEREKMLQERAQALVVAAQAQVDKNPTDPQNRYNLGEQLVHLGNYSDAIAHLQLALRNPHLRIRSMNLLGKCYAEKKMYDLAAGQFEKAAEELPSMDAVKKSVLYELGLVYEKMDEAAKALHCMKQIYEADYGYRDVAQRVEASYASGAEQD